MAKDKSIKKINWDMGFDCFMCRYNHPHGHTIEEVGRLEAQKKGISIGFAPGYNKDACK